jgi:Tfp pilus assembly protein PilO
MNRSLQTILSSPNGAGGLLKIDVVGVATCAVITLAGYLAGARPLLNSRDDRAQQQVALIDARQSVSTLAGSARSLRTQFTGSQLALAKIQIALQPASSLNQRIAELTNLAVDCQLEVQFVQPGSIVSGSRFAQIPIQVAGTGSSQACSAFLHRLRGKFPDISVRDFDLSTSPADASHSMNFSYQLTWFVQPAADNPKS